MAEKFALKLKKGASRAKAIFTQFSEYAAEWEKHGFAMETKESKLYSTVFFAFNIILLRILLEIIYTVFISKLFSQVFSCNFDWVRCLFSWAIFLLSLPFITKLCKMLTFSSMVTAFLYFMAFLPGIILYVYKPTPFILWFLLYWFILLAAAVFFPKIQFRKNRYYFNDKVFIALALFLVVISVFVWGYYSGFRVNFNLFDVYEFRAEASEYDMPVLLVYIYSAAKSLTVLLLVYALWVKKYFLAALLFFAQICYFFVDGSKSALFNIGMTLLAYILIRSKDRRVMWSPLFVSGITFLSIIEKLVVGTYYIINLFIRRMFFLPANLNYAYYDFFTKNPIDLFRQGFLGRLGFVSPYEMSIQHLIAGNYFGSFEMSSNNGLFSDAYANLGIVGIFLMPLLIVLFLKLVEACAKGLPVCVTISVAISLVILLVSSSFFTVMLTHGAIAMTITLLLLPRSTSAEKK